VYTTAENKPKAMGEDSGFSGKLVLGLLISFVGNAANGIGFLIQKIGHNRVISRRATTRAALYHFQTKLELLGSRDSEARAPSEEELVQLKQLEEEVEITQSNTFLSEGAWIFGFGIYVVGSLMHVASLGFGPQSLLTPMEAVTLVTNAMFAPLLLGEHLSREDIWGTVIIIVGTTLTVVFGPHSSISYTADAMVEMLKEPPFLMWSFITVAGSVGVYINLKIIEYRHARVDPPIVMDGDMKKPHATTLCMSMIWIAGMLSSYTMLTAKQVAELLEATLSGINQFDNPVTYGIIFFFVFFNFTMEYWKQKALSSFSALIVVPVFQVSMLVLSVVGGAIYFKEFSGMEWWRSLFFSLSLGIVCVGIFILARSQASKEQNITLYTSMVCVLVVTKLLRRLRKKQEAAMKISIETAGAIDKVRPEGCRICIYPFATGQQQD